MRIKIYIIILIYTAFSWLKAQNISPYLEVKSNDDFNFITVDSLQSNYLFNHFLGDIQQQFYYTNNSNKKIDLRFIVPQNNSSNIYQLDASFNNKKIELASRPLQNVKQEVKQLKSKNSYENQIITQNIILALNDVEPGAKIKIELKRSQIIDPNTITYEVNIPESILLRTEEFTSTQQNHKNSTPKIIRNQYIFTGSIPLDKILFDDKKITINKINPTEWVINDKTGNYKRISYQYQAKNINANIQNFTENGCDYILGIIQPPEEIKTISPREYIFVLDASGSMKGNPLDAIKKMIKSTLKQLKPDELFNILLYSTNHENLAATSIEATPENLEKAFLFIEKEYGKGNIKLNEAIEKIQNFKPKPNYNRIITIISDGDLAINQNVHLAIKTQLKTAQFFILGLGNTIDYRAMNYLALTTGSKPLVINNDNEINYKINQFEKSILTPLLRNIQIQSKNFNFNETYPKNFNGYLATKPVEFVSRNCKKTYPKQIDISAKNGTESFNKSFYIEKENTSNLTKAIKFYWAKQHIDFLLKDEDRCGDMCKNDGRYRKEIEKIGTEFNISTPYSVLIQNNDNLNFNQDYDSDGDGIADWYDECINEKGTLLTKGCPVNQLKNESKELYIQDISNELIRTIEFDLDKAIIQPIDHSILNKIIRLMKENSDLKFYIIGHTDARGTKEYNYNLALNRATAVLNYFIEKGLKKERFTIISKGDTELKHSSCRPATVCEEWRNLQNRRVEFKLKKD